MLRRIDRIELAELERRLAVELSKIGELPPVFSPKEKRYEGWLVCSLDHAIRHDLRVPTITIPEDVRLRGLYLYSALGRLIPGDDLVFAIGDIQ